MHLPFEMPSNASRLDIHLDYDHRIGASPLLSGGNTLDLGIFDARGIAFLAAGTRGWSGSERLSFFIGETEASPGYLPGALMPGTWNVLLGLYKLAPEGCNYTVTVTITTEAGHAPSAALPKPVGELPASSPRGSSGTWLRGELHCHTLHSDGDTSPAEVVRLARERGLDFLAVTDHNTVSGQRALAAVQDPGLVLIRGMETTTFKGHFGVWGTGDWVDFRVQTAEDMAAALSWAHERGALTCCNHPKPLGPPWDYDSVTNYDCVEVWNGPWTLLNQMALDFWVAQLAQGRHISALGGSDWHRQSQLAEVPPRAPGTPTTWVHVSEPPSARAILDAIHQGHVSLSDEPDGPFVELRAGTDGKAMAGDTLPRPASGRLTVRVNCRGGQGNHLQLFDQQNMLYDLVLTKPDETVTTELSIPDSLPAGNRGVSDPAGNRGAGYVRAELRGEMEELKAMTNPIYVEG